MGCNLFATKMRGAIGSFLFAGQAVGSMAVAAWLVGFVPMLIILTHGVLLCLGHFHHAPDSFLPDSEAVSHSLRQ